MLRVNRSTGHTRATLKHVSLVLFALCCSESNGQVFLSEPAGFSAEATASKSEESWVITEDASVCLECSEGPCQCPSRRGIFPDTASPGLIQRFLHRDHNNGSCWTFSTDAVLFWRNAPPPRELAALTAATEVTPALNADQLESSPAAGPRFRIMHTDSCGNAAEFVYLRAFNFRSQRMLDEPAVLTSRYQPADLFGNTTQDFLSASVNLGSSFQTFEANSRTPIGAGSLTFVSGFRWFEFQEAFTMDTSVQTLQYNYRSSVVNSLYGGQLGIDALVLTTPWLRINSWLKGGAYYNNAVQHASYESNVPIPASFQASVSKIPAAGSFVGEVGINSTIDITSSIGIRFGYTGFWLETIALATQQLSDQRNVKPNAGTVLQGVHVGVEGSW